ncbi:TetR/AcrR family transcriptional regulator [Afipia massiliensis]|uniref:TetR/AcrR family transcriptional regulator n=1 Tax=Afipia massiliensis TaxID=211460 RepID=UPI00069AF468|nr:TetR/AcrR family transcriptional regulator [Afipia massiliensis]
MKDTDLRCLAAAEELFAVRGFEGTSLREVSAAVGITSAALIHHFGTKERLYGLVLERLAKSLDSYIMEISEPASIETVVRMFERFLDWSFDQQHLAQLLLRELMENRTRVSRARRMHLLSLIASYVGQIRSGQKSGALRQFDAELFVYYTLGAITHFSAAAPTIDRMLRVDLGDAISRFRLTLRDNVAAMLTANPNVRSSSKGKTSARRPRG